MSADDERSAWDCAVDGHDYAYDRGECKHSCRHCGQSPPPDWYAMEDDY